MMIVMIINLYTVRIVLRALGSDDYAIFQVVAGIVISFQSFSSVIGTATLRFYSYSLGERALEKLSEIFSTSVNIYCIIGLIILLLGESLGVWFVNYHLKIPIDRQVAANWIYQFALFSLILTIMISPFSSMTIAHEDMGFFAVVSLSESFLKLLAIIAISFSHNDRLILYGLSLMIIPVISFCAYFFKTRSKYQYVHYCKVRDKRKYRDILSFSGWHLFSVGASVGINQVNTILINLFFPLVVNTARGVALNVMGAFNSLCSSFMTAVKPPLIKAYAEKNYDYLNRIFNFANKFVYYLAMLVAVPMFFEMHAILKLWLGETTSEMVLFSRLILIYSLILVINNPISIVIQATGKIRQYFIPVESVTLTCPIITYFLFKAGCPPQATFYAMIGTIAVAHIIRVICLKKCYVQFEVRNYIFRFIGPACIITLLDYCFLRFVKYFIVDNPIVFIVISILFIGTTIIIFGLNKEEKLYILKMFHIMKRPSTPTNKV